MKKKIFTTIFFTVLIGLTLALFSYGFLQVEAINPEPIAKTQSGNTTNDKEIEVYVEPAAIPIDDLWKAVEVSCIYNDGKIITKSYDALNNKVYAKIADYATAITKKYEYDVNDFELLSTFVKQSGAVPYDKYNWCSCKDKGCYKNNQINAAGKTKINECNFENDYSYQLIALAQLYNCNDTYRRWIINTESGDYNTLTAVYFYQWDYGPLNTDGQNYLHVYDILERTKANTKVLVTGTQVKLVAERVEFIGNTLEKAIKLVNKSTQATGENEYISIGYYNNMDVWYLDDGDAITSVEFGAGMKEDLTDVIANDAAKGRYYCISLSEKEMSPSEGSSEYTFTQARHKVIGSATCVSGCVDADGENYDTSNDVYACPNGGKLYEGVGTVSGDKGATLEKDICEVIPETAIVLAKVLNILQIIVPVLVLIYTAIDITRIVVAGNIEEELPKRKKAIVIRLIVMIAFFFLPLIVRVAFSTIYGTDVGTVDCVYETADDLDELENKEENSKEKEGE